ncbi:ABC transporter permease OS=Streptomyces cyaneofuscatus OX=66883 GN=G3I52_26275 PE=3 SV=1 [Streptomyces cyaneofuscatus]
MDALRDYYPQFIRTLYAGTATILCLLLGYPLAYLIAFKAGRWRNLVLVLVIAPFFTSFLIRTLRVEDGGRRSPTAGASRGA